MERSKLPTFILTADDSLMLNPTNGLYSSYVSCFPTNILTKPEFKKYFQLIECYPDGEVKVAPLSLRVLEAILNRSGFRRGEYITTPRRNLKKLVGEETKVIAVSTIDPEGLGPLTRTLQLFYRGEEPYTKKAFKQLMAEIRALKEKYNHVRVIVGGPGAWQLSSEKLLDRYGIDYLVMGEAEEVVPKLFRSIAEGEDCCFPRIIRGTPADVDIIPPILNATIGGLVEASRGCGRGCSWCFSSSFGGMRCIPIETIKRSIEANVMNGVTSIALQSDDILLYGSKSKKFIPDSDAVISLFKDLYSVNGVGSILPLHFSIASIVSNPELLHKITALIRERATNPNGEKFVVQVGIETGSPRILEKYMRGKALPFSPKEWPEIVREALTILEQEGWLCYGTMIIGFPDENEEDIIQTIELIKSLRGFRMVIIPLAFTPLNLEEAMDMRFLRERILWEYLPLLYEIKRHNEKISSLFGEKAISWIPNTNGADLNP
ncbi:MAG: radical SAM protein [Candidatus Bathyarchaeia archaeon]|nr:B12-binding domain-containing radical SAM protein [Candidatus Bathyarchaeota archaeon]